MLFKLKNLVKFEDKPRVAQAVIVTCVAATVDFLWVLWIKAVAERYILAASLLSMVMGTVSLFGVTTIIERRWTFPYWILGLGIGTALAMAAHVS